MGLEDDRDWICPDLRAHWQLVKLPDRVLLRDRTGQQQWEFSQTEGFALRYFTGIFTGEKVQQFCQQELGDTSPSLVTDLAKQLVQYRVLEMEQNTSQYQLKPSVQWYRLPEGSWILRNRDNVTRQMQVSNRHKNAIEQLSQLSPSEVMQQCQISADELRLLLSQLSATGMLTGTEPAKPPKRKFTPMQLLFFTIPVGNPDRWLSRSVDDWLWLWTPGFGVLLSGFLAVSAVYGTRHQMEFTQMAMELWTNRSLEVSLLFGLLTLLVVSLHELGHALTLKHFDRVVPEVGLMFMCLMPSAYTNTTDQYALTRSQRALVVGAGVICQVTMAAVGLWLWLMTDAGAGLHTAGYLLLTGAMLTVAINLNPLSKFDGYYLTVALTGINNLRSRSFGFYANLLRRRPVREQPRDSWILAAYAPFSLTYSLMVFGFLLTHVLGWTVINMPAIALLLFLLWAIYFYFPTEKSRP